MKSRSIIVVLAASAFAASSASAQVLDSCGTVTRGAECMLFAADSGGEYIAPLPWGSQVGDRLHVAGFLIPDCVSICQQGNGCVSHRYALGPCDSMVTLPCEADHNRDGVAGVQDIFDYITAWQFQLPDADFDLQNGVTVQDLFAFIEALTHGCP
jgi:hypothetical protein